ncbi:MAG: hypothetical protein RR415_08640 [Ruthenibacterium sp.]
MNIINKLLEKPNLGTLKYVERQPVRDYVDGKASSNVAGYKYVCVAPTMAFAQVVVKIMGAAQLDEPEQPYDVIFDNLSATPYTNAANRPDIAFKADKIHPAKG